VSGQEDGFLSRWSRLKRQPEPEPEPEPELELERESEIAPDAPDEAEVAPPAPQACPIPGVPEIDLSALPRIEDLTEASDFTLFLRPGIPVALRGAALRRMWSLDPTIRDFIGPSDYAWDYNNPAGMPPGFSLDIGGKLKELLAQAIGERPETPDDAAPEAQDAAPDDPDPPSLLAEATPSDPALVGEIQAEPVQDPAQDPGQPRRRHGGAMPA